MERSGLGAWSRVHLVVGVILLVIGLGVLVSAAFSTSSDARLKAEGTTLTADVVDAREVRNKRGGTTVSTEYEVKYRFVAGGSLLAGGSVIVSDWTGAPEAVVTEAVRRGTIEISYLPSDPTVNKPVVSLGDVVGSFGFPVGPIIAGALFIGVGGLIVRSGRPKALPARPAGESSPATGAITGGGSLS